MSQELSPATLEFYRTVGRKGNREQGAVLILGVAPTFRLANAGLKASATIKLGQYREQGQETRAVAPGGEGEVRHDISNFSSRRSYSSYSDRSAVSGSPRVARMAGTSAALAAMAESIAETPRKVTQSYGETPFT